ncbi:hypothetical protein [Conexibacter sp. S30A1]|uniref:hypothetical protein n=1 Tax=Conexibacter sp. S30A1 TaxID=2937800 RepID=UPI00200F178E|nr:hypothetical protein [Conexibacter sp. S30A1]
MSAIYLRDGDEFVVMREAKYDAEAVLQSLLAEHPEILAGGESTGGWVLVRREAGIPDAGDSSDRWSLDHLFLDAGGVPTLVEVKRSSDTRARREVVAQMLDYAANATAFWRVELLRSWFEDEAARAGSSAAETLLATLGVDDEAAYWATVQTNLAADRIRLVFVADEIASELRTIIEFLNRRMTETEVFAIEVKQYIEADGSRQTIVPRAIGQTEAARATKRSRRAAAVPFDPANAPAGFHELITLMDALAMDLHLRVTDVPTGRRYRPAPMPGVRDESGISVLGSSYEFMTNLQVFRDLGATQLADDLLDRLSALAGNRKLARNWPSVPCQLVVNDWERARREAIEPYFVARAQLTVSSQNESTAASTRDRFEHQ